MHLYLLRHAAAESDSASGRDFDRQLTTEGITALERVVTAARDAGLNPDLILSSPYLRAMQTAQITQGILNYEDDIVQSHLLTPDVSPQDLWDEVRVHRDQASILVVAHQPLLSHTASWMLGSTRNIIDFAPATMVCIGFESITSEPRGVLRRVFPS